MGLRSAGRPARDPGSTGATDGDPALCAIETRGVPPGAERPFGSVGGRTQRVEDEHPVRAGNQADPMRIVPVGRVPTDVGQEEPRFERGPSRGNGPKPNAHRPAVSDKRTLDRTVVREIEPRVRGPDVPPEPGAVPGEPDLRGETPTRGGERKSEGVGSGTSDRVALPPDLELGGEPVSGGAPTEGRKEGSQCRGPAAEGERLGPQRREGASRHLPSMSTGEKGLPGPPRGVGGGSGSDRRPIGRPPDRGRGRLPTRRSRSVHSTPPLRRRGQNPGTNRPVLSR